MYYIISILQPRRDGFVVSMWKVVGLHLSQVIPKTIIKMVQTASLLGMQEFGSAD